MFGLSGEGPAENYHQTLQLPSAPPSVLAPFSSLFRFYNLKHDCADSVSWLSNLVSSHTRQLFSGKNPPSKIPTPHYWSRQTPLVTLLSWEDQYQFDRVFFRSGDVPRQETACKSVLRRCRLGDCLFLLFFDRATLTVSPSFQPSCSARWNPSRRVRLCAGCRRDEGDYLPCIL